MTAEKTKLPYQERMDNWIIEQHSDCANFKRAKEWALDRKSTRLNSSHIQKSRMPSSA